MAIDSFSQHCRQEADTVALAERFSQILSQFLLAKPKSHINISLEGDLGAGKTTFARHLIQGIGYVGRVKSPTYTLCEIYPLTLENAFKKVVVTAHHFDLYRMTSPLEWQEAGFSEYFDLPGFCLIEWPEKAEGTLPPCDIQIRLSAGTDDESRDLRVTAHTTQGVDILVILVPPAL